MATYSGSGMVVFVILVGVVVFIIAVFLIRWIFGIGKIVDLLTVIAQELRARNLSENVIEQLEQKGMTNKLVGMLNKLPPMEYRETTKKPEESKVVQKEEELSAPQKQGESKP
jgi:hypothetical protein